MSLYPIKIPINFDYRHRNTPRQRQNSKARLSIPDDLMNSNASWISTPTHSVRTVRTVATTADLETVTPAYDSDFSITPSDQDDDMEILKDFGDFNRTLQEEPCSPDSSSPKEDTVPIPLKVPLAFWNKLFPFQQEGVRFILQRNGKAIVGDEMGLGKTLQAIAALLHYQHNWPALVVCPSSTIGNWEREICVALDTIEPDLPEGHTDSLVLVESCGDASLRRSRHELPQLTCRSIRSATGSPYQFLPSDREIMICSYDIARRLVEAQVWTSQTFGAIVIDESHMVKNLAAKRTVALMQLTRNVPRVILLSGTPMLSRISELQSQLSIVGVLAAPAMPSHDVEAVKESGTQDGTATVGGSGSGAVWNNYPELRHETLVQAIRSVAIRRRKQDIMKTLPPKVHINILFGLSIADGEFFARGMRAVRGIQQQLMALGAGPGAGRRRGAQQAEVRALEIRLHTMQSKMYMRASMVKRYMTMGIVSTLLGVDGPQRTYREAEDFWNHANWERNDDCVSLGAYCRYGLPSSSRRRHPADIAAASHDDGTTTSSKIPSDEVPLNDFDDQSICGNDVDDVDDVDNVDDADNVDDVDASMSDYDRSCLAEPTLKRKRSMDEPSTIYASSSHKRHQLSEADGESSRPDDHSNAKNESSSVATAVSAPTKKSGQSSACGNKAKVSKTWKTSKTKSAPQNRRVYKEHNAWLKLGEAGTYGCSGDFSGANVLFHQSTGNVGAEKKSGRVWNCLEQISDEKPPGAPHGQTTIVQSSTEPAESSDKSSLSTLNGSTVSNDKTLHSSQAHGKPDQHTRPAPQVQTAEVHEERQRDGRWSTVAWRPSDAGSSAPKVEISASTTSASPLPPPKPHSDTTVAALKPCEKLLVFAHHTHMLHAIMNHLDDVRVPYVVITGSTPGKARTSAVEAFQTDPSIRVAVLSIKAAGVGITMTAASTVLFAELQWTPSLMVQAEDRVHRIGQRDSQVRIIRIVVDSVFDKFMMDMLARKAKQIKNVMNVARSRHRK